ncbi:MAG: replicative DNA helicase [Patescibacteria group bacterium]
MANKSKKTEGFLPPQNIEAEQSVLGALMLDKEAIIKIADILEPNDFYRGSHANIFKVMLDLYEKNEPIDLISLTNRLEERNQLEEIGGTSYLTSLVNSVPTAAHVIHYAKIIKNKKVLRDLINSSTQISQLSYQEPEDVEILLDLAEQKIFGISQKSISQKFVHVKDSLEDAFERLDRLHRGDEITRGVPTGFIDLDNHLSGLQKSDLIILGARPSLGKCLVAETEIVDPLTGQISTIEEIVKNKKRDILTLDKNLKIKKTKINQFVDDGKKPIFEVKTALGKKIKTTLAHPFLTINGWEPLQKLKVNQRIAIPRTLSVFGNFKIPDFKIKSLAYFIADGGLTSKCPHFTNSNKRIMADFKKAITSFPNTKVCLVEKNGTRTPTLRVSNKKQDYSSMIKKICQRIKEIRQENNFVQKELVKELNLSHATVSAFFNGHYLPQPSNLDKIIRSLNISEKNIIPQGFDSLRNKNEVTEWLKSIGLMGKLAIEKEIPSFVFELNKKQLALFLNRLFSCDGSIYATQGLKRKSFGISYSSSSEKMIKQVQHLILRFGIISKVRRKNVKYKSDIKISYELEVHNVENIASFIDQIGLYGKEETVQKIKKQISKIGLGWTQDTLPIEIWSKIAKIKGKQTWRAIYKKIGLPISHNIHAFTRNPRRQTVKKIAKALKSERLKQLAQSDIYWDRITNIKYIGKKQVYDLTIPKTHNFIANDFFVHNTSLALDIVRHISSKQKIPVAIFSIEMSKEQLVDRLICAQAEVDSWRMRTGRLSGEGPDNDFQRIQQALDELSGAPIFIDDTPSPTVMQMRTMTRRLLAEHDLGLVVVDYIQMIQPRNYTDSPVQQMTEISRSLKSLARELNIPILAISQLSRAVESRSPAIPKLSDLRDSGTIEQDSDVVLFIYREDKDKPNPERRNIAEIHIAKHRNGPTGKIELFFNETQISFKNLERHLGE